MTTRIGSARATLRLSYRDFYYWDETHGWHRRRLHARALKAAKRNEATVILSAKNWQRWVKGAFEPPLAHDSQDPIR